MNPNHLWCIEAKRYFWFKVTIKRVPQCRSIDTKIIDVIISIGSSSEYDQFLLQEEIYSLFIKKCPEIKYLNIRGTYEIVYLPEAKFRLESLCELTCDTLIDPRYFYRLAHICQQIQRIIIINKNLKANYGTIKLIELQKNLKYFKWKDEEYLSELLLEDPYKDIFNILKKHANTLNHFENNDFNEKLEKVAYRDLEILKIDFIEIYQVNYIIKNSLYLKELLINDYHWDEDSFNDDSINFIRTIYENCFLIECLSIPIFPLLENHFIEFEKLLKRCQNLRSLYFKDTYYKARELEYGDYLSNSLVKEASINLRVIRISYDIRFSLKAFETFFEKWKGRPAVSIHFDDYYFYHKNGLYMNLISKYKIEG
ncbi:9708_t:CDS:2, partial [Rhizophagus irregularis]